MSSSSQDISNLVSGDLVITDCSADNSVNTDCSADNSVNTDCFETFLVLFERSS